MRKGFTWIEVVVVIFIIGVLLALLLPAIQMAASKKRVGTSQIIESSTPISIDSHSFEYRNHKYIYFDKSFYSGQGGYVHDPDCPCMLKAEND